MEESNDNVFINPKKTLINIRKVAWSSEKDNKMDELQSPETSSDFADEESKVERPRKAHLLKAQKLNFDQRSKKSLQKVRERKLQMEVQKKKQLMVRENMKKYGAKIRTRNKKRFPTKTTLNAQPIQNHFSLSSQQLKSTVKNVAKSSTTPYVKPTPKPLVKVPQVVRKKVPKPVVKEPRIFRASRAVQSAQHVKRVRKEPRKPKNAYVKPKKTIIAPPVTSVKPKQLSMRVEKKIKSRRKRKPKPKKKKPIPEKQERVYRECEERNGRSQKEVLQYMKKQRKQRALNAKKEEENARRKKQKRDQYIEKINQDQRKKVKKRLQQQRKQAASQALVPAETPDLNEKNSFATSSEGTIPPAMQAMPGTAALEYFHEKDFEKEILEFEQKLSSHANNAVTNDDHIMLQLLQETIEEEQISTPVVNDNVAHCGKDLGLYPYHPPSQPVEIYDDSDDESSEMTDFDESEASLEIEYCILEGSNGVDYVLKQKQKPKKIISAKDMDDFLLSPVFKADCLREKHLADSLEGLQSEIEKSRDTVRRSLVTSDMKPSYLPESNLIYSDQRLEHIQDLTNLQLRFEYLKYLNQNTVPWFSDFFSSSLGTSVKKNPLNIFLQEKLHIQNGAEQRAVAIEDVDTTEPEEKCKSDNINLKTDEKNENTMNFMTQEHTNHEKQVQTESVLAFEHDSLINFWNEWADDQQKETQRRLDLLTKKWEEDLENTKTLEINALLGKFLEESFADEIADHKKQQIETEIVQDTECKDKAVGTESDLVSPNQIFKSVGENVCLPGKETREQMVGKESPITSRKLICNEENKNVDLDRRAISEEKPEIDQRESRDLDQEQAVIKQGKLQIDTWKSQIEQDEHLKSLAKSNDDMRRMACDLIETTETLYKRKMEEEKLRESSELASSILRQALRLQPALLQGGPDPDREQMKEKAEKMLQQLNELQNSKAVVKANHSSIPKLDSDGYSEDFLASEADITSGTYSDIGFTSSVDPSEVRTDVTVSDMDYSVGNCSEIALTVSTTGPTIAKAHSEVSASDLVSVRLSSKSSEPMEVSTPIVGDQCDVGSDLTLTVSSPSEKVDSNADSETKISISPQNVTNAVSRDVQSDISLSMSSDSNAESENFLVSETALQPNSTADEDGSVEGYSEPQDTSEENLAEDYSEPSTAAEEIQHETKSVPASVRDEEDSFEEYSEPASASEDIASEIILESERDDSDQESVEEYSESGTIDSPKIFVNTHEETEDQKNADTNDLLEDIFAQAVNSVMKDHISEDITECLFRATFDEVLQDASSI